jgi:hypothetical protein
LTVIGARYYQWRRAEQVCELDEIYSGRGQGVPEQLECAKRQTRAAGKAGDIQPIRMQLRVVFQELRHKPFDEYDIAKRIPVGDLVWPSRLPPPLILVIVAVGIEAIVGLNVESLGIYKRSTVPMRDLLEKLVHPL